MRKLVCLLAACLLPVSHAAVQAVDDSGVSIVLDAPAQRVITLAPHLAEMMFEIGAGAQLVGTVEWSDYPAAARQVPRIGDGFRVDAERVVALQPDVVIAWGGGTPASTIEQLRAMNLPVAVLAPENLESIPGQLEWLGRLTGHIDAAKRESGEFRARLAALRARWIDRSPVRVFYQVSGQPLFTVGRGHTIDELIGICGGENIFSDLDSRAHAVSREAVIARNPEAILAGRYAGSDEALEQWEKWHDLAATRWHNLFSIDAERIARPSARILDGGTELCETLDKARAHRARAD